MKIDASLTSVPAQAGEQAVELEHAGYDAAWSAETNHDPFLPLVAAASTTSTIELGTAIAVAFARNPMNLAQLGWDLQAYTQGRLTLGFGSQIKAHITRRFSMPWTHPARRMRETVNAMHAIWAAWRDQTPLDFQGEFFTHTLMTPNFMPDPGDLRDLPLPRIFIAAVGTLMTETAAECADGYIFHPFHTVKSLDELALPTLRAARQGAGKSMRDFQVSGPVFVATGHDDASSRLAEDEVRRMIAFYGSTPAYRTVLEVHGWGALQSELHVLSQAQRWDDMQRLITDEVLHTFAVVAPPDLVPAEVIRRYARRADRVSFYAPYKSEPALFAEILSRLRQQLGASAAPPRACSG